MCTIKPSTEHKVFPLSTTITPHPQTTTTTTTMMFTANVPPTFRVVSVEVAMELQPLILVSVD